MPRENESIGQGAEERPGFNSAVDRFCDAADGETLGSGDTYLSYATEVEHNGGNEPTEYGQLGFVYCEDCKGYLKKLSEDGGDCSGPDNTDSRGGTFQVINGKLSYHGKPEIRPPQEDTLNKLYTAGVITAQEPNTGDGAPLNPFPLSSFSGIKPVSAHSHNDYDREVPLWTALSTGCISVEVDVWYSNNDVIIGHDSGKAGRTLRAQYIDPLRAILDHNGGAGVYAANTAVPSFTILVDFKSKDTGTLAAVVAALEPLREQGYLSSVVDGAFVERQVTVVASGEAPFDGLNSYYASAKYSDARDEESLKQQVQAAHDLALKVRYYDLDSESDWERLMGLGVDRLNADDLANTARLPRI